MDYEKLKEVIAKQIKENGKREITGPVLQAVLMAMVDSLGEVYPHTYTDEEKAQARANIDALSNHNGEITKEKLSLEVQAILNDVANKQNISDATLATIAKTIVGAINEVYKGGLEDASIATSKIKDGAVTDAKIANGAVTTPKIANDAVTTEKVNDGAITEPKLDTDLVNIITSAVQPAGLASAIATALASYVAKADIVDTTGSATDKVMSQHGVTEAIDGVTNKVTELESKYGLLFECVNYTRTSNASKYDQIKVGEIDVSRFIGEELILRCGKIISDGELSESNYLFLVVDSNGTQVAYKRIHKDGGLYNMPILPTYAKIQIYLVISESTTSPQGVDYLFEGVEIIRKNSISVRVESLNSDVKEVKNQIGEVFTIVNYTGIATSSAYDNIRLAKLDLKPYIGNHLILRGGKITSDGPIAGAFALFMVYDTDGTNVMNKRVYSNGADIDLEILPSFSRLDVYANMTDGTPNPGGVYLFENIQVFVKGSIISRISPATSKWYGKKILCIGDSLTAANSWQAKLRSLTGAIVTTHAKGGIGLITMVDGDSSGFPALSVTDVKNQDLIIILAGVNDFRKARDNNGKRGDMYPAQNTWKGICNYAIEKIFNLLSSANNDGCKVVFASCHCFGENQYMEGETGYSVGDAILEGFYEAQYQYRIPIINCLYNAGIGKQNWSVFCSSESDYVHLNGDGYYKLGEYIAAQIETI